MTTVKVSDDDFDSSVLETGQPVLVDFWAEWCGPCKMIAPALEEIATDMGAKIKVAKINIDDNPQTPAKVSLLRTELPFLMEVGYSEVQYPQGLEVLAQPRPYSELQAQHTSQSRASEPAGPTHVVF